MLNVAEPVNKSDVKDVGRPSYSYLEVVKFRILRGGKKTSSKIIGL